VMRSLLWKIGLPIAVMSAALLVWWLHREKAIARQRSSDAASLRALAEHGDAKAEFDFARMYADGKLVPQDYVAAAAWFRKAAEQGYAKAQFNLGQMYLRGQGVSKDYGEALHWIQKAADQGDAKAEDGLGFMYYNGQGVPQDYAKAALWYRKAAVQGYPVAQQGLAYMYYNGVGVSQDNTEAVRWYRKAAEQGDAVAQEGLGYLYATGRGVPLDRSEAIVWYRKAADQGDVKAKHALESLDTSGLTRTRNFELLTALLGFAVGLWFSIDFLLRRKKLRGRRQAAIAVLGAVFLSHAGLSFYAFAHENLRYSPFQDAFHTARWVLNAAAIVLVISVVLPVNKRQDQTLPAARPR
jgi:TPR repeat protein